MEQTITGIVHGQTTIEVNEPLGLAEGQRVEVTIKAVAESSEKWGDGLLRCAGAMEPYWTEEDDRILDQIYQDRKRSARKLPE